MSSGAEDSELVNVRDVAETATGVDYGVLLRSEAPVDSHYHAPGIANWPPATVVDLRDQAERAPTHPLADTGEVVHLPIIDREQMLEGGFPASLDELYLKLLEQPAASRLIAAIDVVALSPTPVLVHCTAGKDRTGVVVAIVLDLVGIAHSEIIADYVRTNDAIEAIFARLGTLGMAMTPAEFAKSIPENLKGAPESAITGVLERLSNMPGGAEGWFLDNGGEQSTLDALEQRFRS